MTNVQQRAADERAIREMIERWSRAVERRDAAAIVADYTPDTVLYDAIPPHRTVGADAIAAVWEQCFPHFPAKFRSEHRDLAIEVDGDVAYVHGLHRFVPEPADHPAGQTWLRVSVGLRRIGGAWKILHEHVSVPFDPMTGKAAFIREGIQGARESAADRAAAIGMHRVTPHLVCRGAAEAIEFYRKAFGAVEMMRLPGPDGRLLHASVQINGSSVMLVDEFPEMGGKSPATLAGTAVVVHLIVDDVDAVAQRAIEAGAKVVMPVADQFWGDRYGVIQDPFGHQWSIATPGSQTMSAADLQRAAGVPMAASA
jgi:uncharacterized protein (TIGR02246 family)